MAKQNLWTREQLILAINLYVKTTFGRLHRGNPDVIQLAELIGRTPSAVAWKLVNFASLDPTLKERGIKGAVNSSQLDKEVWDEFYQNWDKLPFESEALFSNLVGKSIEERYAIDLNDLPEGKERVQVVKTRVNQTFFRSAILASYENSCCVTGLKVPEFLIASHINRWADDQKNRMNPTNGLCLNALHDKAFENGLMSITPDYIIKISPKLLTKKRDAIIDEQFGKYHDRKMILPKRFLPDPEFLEKHFETRFQS